MGQISAAGRIPLLVGGTMLYFRALQQGLSTLPAADRTVRERLDAEARTEGWAGLHRRLAGVDPETARRVHPNDPQRIQRALEVYEVSGRPMSALLREGAEHRRFPYRVLKLVRAPDNRGILHDRIEQRFLHMLELGFEDEVRGLWARGDLTTGLPAMRCVGYRQMLKYLLGEYTFDEMVQRGIAATRQLAKRQYTWLRAENQTNWLVDGYRPVERALELMGRRLFSGEQKV